MNKNILELTVRLSQALDQNYDVVNMDAVMAVISSLEGTTITKEQLETTRLAKYINQLRRRTDNEHLARRAKSLLKKWREMVGIQQANDPTSSNISAVMGCDNVIAATSSTNLQHHHRSQPTSPIAGGGGVINFEKIINSKATAHVDFLRSTVSNPAVSFTTRSANLNVHTSNNRRLENAERQSEAACASSSAVPTTDNEKQHTSFANLIAGFNKESIGSSSTKTNTGAAAGHNTTPPRAAARKLNKTYVKHTETFIIDQSSNSNSELSCTPSAVIVAPIVIDIQDSNSSSNLIATASAASANAALNSSTPVSSNINNLPSAISSPATSALKLKKSKKEKRRKERDSEVAASYFRHTLPKVIIDETSLNQEQQLQTSVDIEKFVPIMEDKSRIAYPTSNISEILSLSNSSVSSMFPGDGASRVMENQNRSNLAAKSNHTSLSTSDLTFAGKFKQQSNSALATATTTSLKSDLIGFNGSDINSPNTSSKVAVATQIVTSNKFVPFSGSGGGCNSNDSTSNSRASHFEVIDVVSQDNNQSKIIEELRLLKKQDVYVQQNTKPENFMSTQTIPFLALPQQQIADTVESNLATSAIPEKKVPKKRGRKKGSKGVDSVIAKEASLSSQMLITSLGIGCKKVKTTKELYAEMQNRKLGVLTSTSSPKMTNWSHQQLSSRPESSCSEPSLHSPRTLDACSTNATMSTAATRSTPDKYLPNTNADEAGSDSDTITSEPSRDSIAAQKNVERGISIESNSNSQLPASRVNESNKQLAAALTTATIEKQLRELLKQLPLVPSVRTIELGCSSELVPCTCKITEILPQDSDEQQIENNEGGGNQNQDLTAISALKKATNNEAEQQPSVIAANVLKEVPNKTKVTREIKPLPQKPKKSIFDLDFDDDEDPLHTLKAENAAALDASSAGIAEIDLVTHQPIIVIEQQVKFEVTESFEQILQLPLQTPLPSEPVPIFPTYLVDEDPNCVAKNRFELQTQKISKFHINALHNCYIANVNGNWDNADTPKTTINSIENNEAAEVSLNASVVPMYGSLISERIKKDLIHVHFTNNFKPNKPIATENSNYSMPFLGVSRRFQQLRQYTKHTHTKCKIHKSKNAAENLKIKCKNTNEDRNPTCTTIPKIVNCETVTSNIILDETTRNANILETAHKILLKNITIDIAEPQSSVRTSEKVCISTAADVVPINSQNLLAIAQGLNFTNNNILTTSYTNDDCKSYNIEIDFPSSVPSENVIINEDYNAKNNAAITTFDDDDSAIPAIVSPTSLPSTNAVKSYESSSTDVTTRAVTSIDINTSSRRRSSSCSNSSLKQTQQSINLKLRRRREEQKLIEIAQVGQKRRRLSPTSDSKKNKFNTESDTEFVSKCKKPRIIKRIKIAINGDIATQRQISFGSSNNSTDDDGNDNEPPDSDEEDSAGSRNSQFDACKDYNIVEHMVDGETDAIFLGDGDDDETNEPEADDDDDADFDEDDEEYYSGGDFHEVVTRDISATSTTGNNHIVLTIKKTPSKTNSPSNSLSAMSPVIAASTAPGGGYNTSNTLSSVVTRIAQELPPHLDTDASNQQQSYKISDTTTKIKPDILALSAQDEHKENAAGADLVIYVGTATEQYVGNQFSTAAAKFSLQFSSTIAAKSNSSLNVDNVDKDSPLQPQLRPVRIVRKHKRRMRRKVKRLKPFRFPEDNDVVTAEINIATVNSSKKLHQQLFFPHEICCWQYGNKEHILNISSCSSSCAEESEFEYCTSASECSNEKTVATKSKISRKLLNTQHVDSIMRPFPYASNAPMKNTSNFSDVPSPPLTPAKSTSPPSTDTIEKQKDVIFADDTLLKTENIFDQSTLNNSGETKPSDKNDEQQDNEAALLEENNGFLLSFNNICRSTDTSKDNTAAGMDKLDCGLTTTMEDDQGYGNGDDGKYVSSAQQKHRQVEQLKQQLPNKNCDDYNNLYNNNNNFNLIKYTSNKDSLENDNDDSCKLSYKHSSNSDVNDEKSIKMQTEINNSKGKITTQPQLIPHKEYRTGLRAVDEDVDDDDGNNCARIQQFKEWHQVLQLRSYNDELLTVLPYVVLE